MKFSQAFALLIFSINISCDTNVASKEQVVKNFDDNIEDSLNSFWYTHQVAHPDRLQIVKDPDNSENDLLKVSLEPEDKVAKGNRSEIVFKPKDSFGYRNRYSFKFKFPKSFFKKQTTQGHILLNQWHNVPYPGYNYGDQIVKVRVPFALMVEHQPDGTFKMILHYGLRVNTLNDMVWAVWPGELGPDVWYTFENEIFWSLYNDGYTKPKLNDICFEVKGEQRCNFEGANMYHILPHDYKMGLYWNGKQENNIHIFYDDFKMTAERIGYFPPITKKDSIVNKKK
ncbi:heparin lyase I family protein [Rasiella sp. SM2506]|uniref:heparin lyase I family protein n=1 Tax=Rasiella sp. SM2506 TaxID=3423914 RepID=UPI003D7BE833